MRRALPLLALAVAACSPQGVPREQDEPTGNGAAEEAAAVADIQERTEIDALKNRVVTLERELGELKANPEALDLGLLTQRVERLEAGGAALPASGAEPAARPTPADPEQAQRAVDAAIAERRARRSTRD